MFHGIAAMQHFVKHPGYNTGLFMSLFKRSIYKSLRTTRYRRIVSLEFSKCFNKSHIQNTLYQLRQLFSCDMFLTYLVMNSCLHYIVLAGMKTIEDQKRHPSSKACDTIFKISKTFAFAINMWEKITRREYIIF